MKRSKLIQPDPASIASRTRSTTLRLCSLSAAVSGGNMSSMNDPGAPLVDLAGRAVLVTGAARRVGAAIVRGLHADGADVCIHCHRSVAEAEQLRDALNRERPRSAAVAVADLLDLKALPGVIATATGAFGRLDVL